MIKVTIPFGHNYISANIPTENLMGIYEAPGVEPAKDPIEEITKALEEPIGTPPLSKLAKPGKKVCIVVSDITRPIPYKVVLPILLEYLNRCGVKDEDITLLIATGLHRGLTIEEQKNLYGENIVKRVKIINHDYKDKSNLVYLGETSRGTPIEVNRIAVETDVLILTGYIEPHQQFGFTGGRKSIMPGIASEKAVMHNHNAKMMDHPLAVNGVLEGNPQHEDAMEFARAIRVDFILNLVLNQNEKLTWAVGGDLEKAWLKGVELSRSFREVELPHPCDVAITASGFPLDQVLYQGPKITSAVFRTKSKIIKDGGTIILPMEGTEGIGHHREFYELMCLGKPEAIIEKCYTSPVKDQWGAQIWARTLEKVRMIIVTQKIEPHIIEKMGIESCLTLQEAIDRVIARYGRQCKIAVFPRSTTVLPKLAQN
ncbi:MAG: nickel-dependent lactate racemase [Synergistetes bacterium]|nr:nickel-dependent lactate racemase [Synergistota bacterium]MDW8192588.1 nickel-dependent lactate racemase [Synergistota bacterium]